MVETDLMDLEAFNSAVRVVSQLRAAIESGARLIPAFEGFAVDVFAIYYKYNVVLLDAAGGAASLTRRSLSWVLSSPDLTRAKHVTRLDSVLAGLATAKTLSRVISIAKRTMWLNEDDLLAQWKLSALEDDVKDINERLEAAADLLRHAEQDESQSALQSLIGQMEQERDDRSRDLRRVQEQQGGELDRLPAEAENLVRDQVGDFVDELSAVEQLSGSLGSNLGLSRNAHFTDKIALGERLLESKKLRQMAELVGLFKQVARNARKKSLQRRPTAVHSIEEGADLARILSSELVTLCHPFLRKEFLRRLTDRRLSQYALQAPDRTGRGPIVACIDASGSMRGPREIWAKAIALTLLEISRREGRAFRAIVFSASPDQCISFPLLESGLERRLRPPVVDTGLLVRFADFFPGGGTDFEKPLRASVDALRESRFRDGDVVFVSDGGASLSPGMLDWVLERKAELGFKVFAVLIDVGGGKLESLRVFADEILTVRELTTESLEPVFSRV